MSTAPSSNKYYIRSLEEEIGLFDRKLAHLLKFETFPSDAERQVAAGKLSAKRERLIRTVRDLTEGVPDAEATAAPAKKTKAAAKPKTSTRSKTAAQSKTQSRAKSAAPAPVTPVEEPATTVADVPEQPVHLDAETPTLPRVASPYAGTSLDSEQQLKEYLQARAKD